MTATAQPPPRTARVSASGLTWALSPVCCFGSYAKTVARQDAGSNPPYGVLIRMPDSLPELISPAFLPAPGLGGMLCLMGGPVFPSGRSKSHEIHPGEGANCCGRFGAGNARRGARVGAFGRR